MADLNLTDEQRMDLWKAFAGEFCGGYFSGPGDSHWTAGVDRMAAVLAPMLDSEYERLRAEREQARAIAVDLEQQLAEALATVETLGALTTEQEAALEEARAELDRVQGEHWNAFGIRHLHAVEKERDTARAEADRLRARFDEVVAEKNQAIEAWGQAEDAARAARAEYDELHKQARQLPGWCHAGACPPGCIECGGPDDCECYEHQGNATEPRDVATDPVTGAHTCPACGGPLGHVSPDGELLGACSRPGDGPAIPGPRQAYSDAIRTALDALSRWPWDGSAKGLQARRVLRTLQAEIDRQRPDPAGRGARRLSSLVDPVKEDCEACEGTGKAGTWSQPAGQPYADYGPDPCADCRGTGRVTVTNPAHDETADPE